VLLFICATPSLSAGSVKAGIENLKSVYIFNFIRFSDWPAQGELKKTSNIRLHVLGEPEILSVMQSIADKPAGKAMDLHISNCSTDVCIKHASALFIGKPVVKYQHLLQLVAGRPILTISDIPGFASHGGMIEMKYHNKKLTFVVNVQAVKRAGLYISAQLLAVGEVVGRDHE